MPVPGIPMLLLFDLVWGYPAGLSHLISGVSRTRRCREGQEGILELLYPYGWRSLVTTPHWGADSPAQAALTCPGKHRIQPLLAARWAAPGIREPDKGAALLSLLLYGGAPRIHATRSPAETEF